MTKYFRLIFGKDEGQFGISLSLNDKGKLKDLAGYCEFAETRRYSDKNVVFYKGNVNVDSHREERGRKQFVELRVEGLEKLTVHKSFAKATISEISERKARENMHEMKDLQYAYSWI